MCLWMYGQYGWHCWALVWLKLSRCSHTHQSPFPFLLTGIKQEQIKHGLWLVFSKECTIKDITSWALLILYVSTLITQINANTLVLILLGCANKIGKKEWVFFKVENVRACVSPWSLVSVVAHPNDRRSHPIQPTNPFAYLHILHICQSIGCIVKTSFPHSFSVASPRIPLKHIVSQMPNHGLCSTMNTIFLPYLMRF